MIDWSQRAASLFFGRIALDEHTILTLVAVLSGGTGLLGWYKVFTEARQIKRAAETARETLAETAETERLRIVKEAESAAATTALNCWRDFTKALQDRLAVVTKRVDELEKELAAERTQRVALESKVQALEAERGRLQAERDELLAQITEQRRRIDELEGCK